MLTNHTSAPAFKASLKVRRPWTKNATNDIATSYGGKKERGEISFWVAFAKKGEEIGQKNVIRQKL